MTINLLLKLQILSRKEFFITIIDLPSIMISKISIRIAMYNLMSNIRKHNLFHLTSFTCHYATGPNHLRHTSPLQRTTSGRRAESIWSPGGHALRRAVCHGHRSGRHQVIVTGTWRRPVRPLGQAACVGLLQSVLLLPLLGRFVGRDRVSLGARDQRMAMELWCISCCPYHCTLFVFCWAFLVSP